MKKTALTALLVSFALGAFGQGQIVFNNRVTTGTTGAYAPILAPVYGVDPLDPLTPKRGQSAIGTPSGSQTYGGALLAGTSFTASLWAGISGTTDGNLSLVPGTSVAFRTGAGAGYVSGFGIVVVPGVTGDSAERATFQLRAWNNLNGTVTSWAAAMANPLAARGTSDAFTLNAPLGGGTTVAPNLIGLTSFNLTIVPEPGVIALGVLGLGALLLRRRK